MRPGRSILGWLLLSALFVGLGVRDVLRGYGPPGQLPSSRHSSREPSARNSASDRSVTTPEDWRRYHLVQGYSFVAIGVAMAGIGIRSHRREQDA